jgi:hypothetical protein
MLGWKITMIVVAEMRLLVRAIKKEKSMHDEDSPGVLTRDELSFIISERLLNLTPKIMREVMSHNK